MTSSETSVTLRPHDALFLSATNCESRCETKFTMCGAAAADGKDACMNQVCNASPTADQLTCLETKTCRDISNSMDFKSLCPGTASTSGGTSGTTPTGVTCGTATCAATEYCSLRYDSAMMSWTPSSCKKVPAACSSSSAADLCSCMKMNAGCPTTGVISTKCSQSNGGLSFGCN